MINACFWNIRGISKPPNLRRFKKLVCMHKLAVVGICESKLSFVEVESIRIRLYFDSVVCNSSGEVWIFFRAPFARRVIGESDQHMCLLLGHPRFPTEVFVSFAHAKC